MTSICSQVLFSDLIFYYLLKSFLSFLALALAFSFLSFLAIFLCNAFSSFSVSRQAFLLAYGTIG